MRFSSFRKFNGSGLDELLGWVKSHLNSGFDVLYSGLAKLAFEHNFNSFKWEGTIAANTELGIDHPFGVVPAGYLIYQRNGGLIEKGPTAWTKEKVYMRNQSSTSTATTIIIFFRGDV